MDGHDSDGAMWSTSDLVAPATDDTGQVPQLSLGRRALLAGAFGAIAGATVFRAHDLVAFAAGVEPGASFFQPVDPARLCDTRPRPGAPSGFGYERLNANTIRVQIAGQGGSPPDAVAAVLTVTGVMPRVWNYLSVYPSGGSPPNASSVNLAAHDFAVANLVTVKLGPGGAVDIFQYSPCDVVVDVAGVYRPTSVPVEAGRMIALNSAVRPLDTRRTGKPGPGGVVQVNLNGIVPANAVAIVANLTSTEATSGGYVTAYPRGTAQPATSSLNVNAGQTRAVGIMTKLGTSGGIIGIDVYTERGTHLLLDVAGYITGVGDGPSGVGLFVPIEPTRLLDTRQTHERLWNGWTKAFSLPAPIESRAQAVAMNLTVTQTATSGGYFTLHAAQTPRREVSNLNAEPNETVANHAITRISRAGVACYSYGSAHIICDVFGWFTGSPAAVTTAPPFNPPPPGGLLPWIVQIPRLGLSRWVYDGDPNRIVDAGHTWHWTGTGLVGQGVSVVLFGHRTEHGGPYRYQHNLRGGDLLHITTSDGRRYNYQMAAEYLSTKYPNDILAKTRLVGGETVSLVSCTKLNRLPTDVNYRLISTFRLINWDDLA